MTRLMNVLAILVFASGLTLVACGSDDGETTTDVVVDNDNVGTQDGVGTDTEDDGYIGKEDVVCTPSCANKVCGPDGCGSTCGSCEPGIPCVDGMCNCTPDCDGKACGPDNCGGSCGTCADGGVCDSGLCCTPNCDGKECGTDGCGGACGLCPSGYNCDLTGTCVAGDTGGGCPGIFDCLNACPAQDAGCQQNCINEAEVEDQMAFNNLITCLQDSGYWDCDDDDTECINTASAQCEAQMTECFHGELSCKDMYLCLTSCPNDATGEACAQDCLANGSVEGQAAWTVFLDCLDLNGYFDCADGDSDCMQTAWEACDVEFKACAHGDKTCTEIMDCLNTCSPTDDICPLACQLNGTVVAQTAFGLLVDCIVETCGDDTSVECQNTAMNGACADPLSECQSE